MFWWIDPADRLVRNLIVKSNEDRIKKFGYEVIDIKLAKDINTEDYPGCVFYDALNNIIMYTTLDYNKENFLRPDTEIKIVKPLDH